MNSYFKVELPHQLKTYKFICFFMILIGAFIRSSLSQLTVTPKSVSVISKCLIFIIQTDPKPMTKISMENSPKRADDASDILSHIKGPVVINANESSNPQRVQTDYVIILNEELNVTEILNRRVWFQSTRFLVVLNQISNIGDVFGHFWKQKVINVFILIEDDNGIRIYSYAPYKAADCGIGEPLVVDLWINGKFQNKGAIQIQNGVELNDLHGCIVNISIVHVKPNVLFEDECNCNGTMHIEGIEGRIINEIARKLNFKGRYRTPRDGNSWGWIHPSPHGVVGEVFTGQSDFGFGLLAPTVERYESLDLSATYNHMECITFGLPKGAGPVQPTWINILVFEFPPLMWILICIFFTIIVLTFWMINKTKKSSKPFFDGKVNLLIFIFSSCLGYPVRVPVHFLFRVLFISWAWFTFILTVAYKSSMGSKLTVPMINPDIHTFKELLDSHLDIIGPYNILRIVEYQSSNDDVFKKVAQQYVNYEDDVGYMVERIVTYRKMSFALHATTFLYHANILPKTRGKVNVMDQCIYNYYPRFVTKKGSPFSNTVNEVISHLSQSGIVQFWRSEFVPHIARFPNPFVKLSMYHILGSLSIMVLGYILSTFVFILELTNYYCKARTKKTEQEEPIHLF